MLIARLKAIAIFGTSFSIAAFVVANKHFVDGMLVALGPFSIPAAILIFAIVASAPFSVTDALAVSNGVLFGPWLGSAVNAAGLILAAILGYLVALRTAKLLKIEEQIVRLPAWVRRYRVGSPMFLILVRIIPGLGGTIATQTAASLHVPIWRQIYTMAIVTIPLCTLLAFGGNLISDYVERHIVTPAQHYAQRHHRHLPHRSQNPQARSWLSREATCTTCVATTFLVLSRKTLTAVATLALLNDARSACASLHDVGGG